MRFVCLSNDHLAKAMHASPRLARSLLAGDILNRVWICSDDSRTPIEALTFLLAQAIGDDWPEERVGVVVLRPTPELWFRADDSADDTFHRYGGTESCRSTGSCSTISTGTRRAASERHADPGPFSDPSWKRSAPARRTSGTFCS